MKPIIEFGNYRINFEEERIFREYTGYRGSYWEDLQVKNFYDKVIEIAKEEGREEIRSSLKNLLKIR